MSPRCWWGQVGPALPDPGDQICPFGVATYRLNGQARPQSGSNYDNSSTRPPPFGLRCIRGSGLQVCFVENGGRGMGLLGGKRPPRPCHARTFTNGRHVRCHRPQQSNRHPVARPLHLGRRQGHAGNGIHVRMGRAVRVDLGCVGWRAQAGDGHGSCLDDCHPRRVSAGRKCSVHS